MFLRALASRFSMDGIRISRAVYNRQISLAVVLGVSAFILSIINNFLMRDVQGHTAIWPVNGLVLARLLQTEPKTWSLQLFCATIGVIGANLICGLPLMISVGLSIANLVEILICCLGWGRLAGGDIEVTDIRRTFHLAAFNSLTGLVAPAVSATLAILCQGPRDPAVVTANWIDWVTAHGLGVVILGTAFLALTPRILASRTVPNWRYATLFILLALVLGAVFLQAQLPLLFLVLPVLVLMTADLGFLGGALALLITVAVSVILTSDQYGPIAHLVSDPGARLMVLRLFLAAAALSVLPLASLLRHHRRLEVTLRESEAILRNAGLESARNIVEGTAELAAVNAQLTEALRQRTKDQHVIAKTLEQYRVSFDRALVGKVQSDPATGQIIRANRAFADMLGYEPDELVGSLGWQLTWPEDQIADRAEYAKVVSGERDAYVREVRFSRADGEPIWARVSANVARYPESGEPDIAVAVVENIDESHKAREALQAAKRDLEQVVEDRTTALAQRDLLLREVYHRVKNNLQIVDSFIFVQMRQIEDSGIQANLQSLRDRIYALGLVHSQLMGSTNLKTFDIAPFLVELSANLIDGVSENRISLSVKAIPLQVGLDLAIPLALVATELVTNAIKHAFPVGRGRIDVQLDRNEHGALTFVISDDGQGFAPRPTTPPNSKAGLGHEIVRSLVVQLKGTMTMHHEKGTRIIVTVPAPAAQ